MFFNKKDDINVTELVNDSKKMVAEMQKGQFTFQLDETNNEKLNEIVSCFNEASLIRTNFEERQQQKIDILLNSSKTGFWEIDIVGNTFDHPENKITISEELKSILGYSSNDIKNTMQDLVRLTDSNHAKEIRSLLDAHLRDKSGKTAFTMTHKALTKNQGYIWVKTFGFAKRDAHGNPYRMIVLITDIHEEKMNEEQLDAYVTRYDLIMDVLEEAPWDMEILEGTQDVSENTWWFSNQFREALGFTNEVDFPNQMNSWSDRLHPDDVDHAFEAFEKHLDDRSGRTPFSVEYRLQRKSGDYRWYTANGEWYFRNFNTSTTASLCTRANSGSS